MQHWWNISPTALKTYMKFMYPTLNPYDTFDQLIEIYWGGKEEAHEDSMSMKIKGDKDPEEEDKMMFLQQ